MASRGDALTRAWGLGRRGLSRGARLQRLGNGEQGFDIWRAPGLGSIYASPAVAYSRVYVGSLDGGIYALGQATGHLWARPTGGYVYASPAIWNHRVLVGSYDDHFYAIDAGAGEIDWRFDAHARIFGAASVIDGLVYVSTFNKRTFALTARSGREVARWLDGRYSPAVADAGHLYLVGLGRLYALAPFDSASCLRPLCGFDARLYCRRSA